MRPGVTNPREEIRGDGRRTTMFALTLLLVLAAVFVSAGLVVYTAWHHDLKNGLFALAFAVLSARAVLSWILWHSSSQPFSSSSDQQDRADRKPPDEPLR
jgi:hypothetical protein